MLYTSISWQILQFTILVAIWCEERRAEVCTKLLLAILKEHNKCNQTELTINVLSFILWLFSFKQWEILPLYSSDNIYVCNCFKTLHFMTWQTYDKKCIKIQNSPKPATDTPKILTQLSTRGKQSQEHQ